MLEALSVPTLSGCVLFRLLGICAAVLLVVSVALSVGVGTALATDCGSPTYWTQGIFIRGVGRDNATRSYISGTATNNSCGMVLFSVAEQNHNPGDTTDPVDMMQVGEIKEDNNFGDDDCNSGGSVGIVAVFREYVSNDLGKSYHCDVLTNIARSDFGSGGNFAVAIATHWQAFYNSSSYGLDPIELGFSSGYTIARAEAAWSSTAPSYDVTWGPSGQTPKWQFETNSSGCCTSYTNVSDYTVGTGQFTLPGFLSSGTWAWDESSPPAFAIDR